MAEWLPWAKQAKAKLERLIYRSGIGVDVGVERDRVLSATVVTAAIRSYGNTRIIAVAVGTR